MTRSARFAATLLATTLLAPFAIAQSAFAQDVVSSAPDLDIELIGRAMIDQTFASADEADTDLNGNEARRLRLGVKGSFGEDIKFKFELNTDSGGDVNAEDAYVQWYPTGGSWSVIVGQDNTHNSFDEQTSSRFISTLERAAFTDAFGLDRRLGVSVLQGGDNYTLAAGVHGSNLDGGGLDDSWALSARGTATPINSDLGLLHVGASYRHRDQGNPDDAGYQGDLRLRQRPYSHLPGRIISTGRLGESDDFYGVELIGLTPNGRAWAGGEYAVTEADTATGDATFDGGYIEAGLMLGGKRTYKKGKFDRPKVDRPVGKGGLGALKLVARYDTLDLTDDTVNGGQLDTTILSADWYLTKYVHIGADAFWSDAELGDQTSGLGGTFSPLVAAGVTEEDVSGVLLRVQFDFGTSLTKF